MSEPNPGRTIDLIRWTFTIDPDRRVEVEAYLSDLGIDLWIGPDGRCVALWDEPEDEADVDAVIDGLWEAAGGPIDVVHEEFGRQALLGYHADDHADDGESQTAA